MSYIEFIQLGYILDRLLELDGYEYRLLEILRRANMCSRRGVTSFSIVNDFPNNANRNRIGGEDNHSQKNKTAYSKHSCKQVGFEGLSCSGGPSSIASNDRYQMIDLKPKVNCLMWWLTSETLRIGISVCCINSLLLRKMFGWTA